MLNKILITHQKQGPRRQQKGDFPKKKKRVVTSVECCSQAVSKCACWIELQKTVANLGDGMGRNRMSSNF